MQIHNVQDAKEVFVVLKGKAATQQGVKRLGSGAYGIAYQNRRGTVTKIGYGPVGRSRIGDHRVCGYSRFLAWACANQNNKHVPQIDSANLWVSASHCAFLIVMEQLESVSFEKDAEKIRLMRQFGTTVEPRHVGSHTWASVPRKVVRAMDVSNPAAYELSRFLVRELWETAGEDSHYGNIMRRKNTVVITDPAV